MIINIVLVITIFVSFALLIKFRKKQDADKTKPILLFSVLILCAVIFLFRMLGSSENDTNSLMKEAKVAAFIMGQELANQMPGAKVLVIYGGEKDDIDEEEALQPILIKALKDGFGDKITDIRLVEPEMKRPEGADYEKYGFTLRDCYFAKDFNKIIADNRDRNLVVSLVPLPYDVENISLWKQFERDPKKTPGLAIVNPISQKLPWGPLIEGGLIKAITLYKPDFDGTSSDSDNIKEYFDSLYILINKDNVSETSKKYPNLLY